MLKIVFNTDENEDDPNQEENSEKREERFFEGYIDLHGQDINVLHLACQEGLTQTVKYII